jgi:hypothetical protein
LRRSRRSSRPMPSSAADAAATACSQRIRLAIACLRRGLSLHPLKPCGRSKAR